jgi:hypothetical protein
MDKAIRVEEAAHIVGCHERTISRALNISTTTKTVPLPKIVKAFKIDAAYLGDALAKRDRAVTMREIASYLGASSELMHYCRSQLKPVARVGRNTRYSARFSGLPIASGRAEP